MYGQWYRGSAEYQKYEMLFADMNLWVFDEEICLEGISNDALFGRCFCCPEDGSCGCPARIEEIADGYEERGWKGDRLKWVPPGLSPEEKRILEKHQLIGARL